MIEVNSVPPQPAEPTYEITGLTLEQISMLMGLVGSTTNEELSVLYECLYNTLPFKRTYYKAVNPADGSPFGPVLLQPRDY